MSTVITELPLYTDLLYRYGTTLEEESKQLTFYWNSRSASWHMDIQNEDQSEVVYGVPLVAQYPILADHPMLEYGLSGYFLLMPVNLAQTASLSDGSSVMPEFFTLFYIYQTE